LQHNHHILKFSTVKKQLFPTSSVNPALNRMTMKALNLLVAAVLVATQPILAQNKNDNTWLVGIGPNIPEIYNGGAIIDFSVEPPNIKYRNLPSMGRALAFTSICDANGNLMAYCNSCGMVNVYDTLIENGAMLNSPGHEFEFSCGPILTGPGAGYPSRSPFFVPWPGSDSKYAYFHVRFDYPKPPHPFYYAESFLYSVVDMAENNGRGKVILKNGLIVKDTIGDMLAAIRHGNGRDWWVVCDEFNSNQTFVALLTPDGVQGPWRRDTPLKWSGDIQLFYLSQAVFSPDGRFYARYNYPNGIQVMGFDRCNGTFTTGLQLLYLDTPGYTVGMAISANSRFLYATNGITVYQFDLEADDVQASRTFIAEYDGHSAPLPTTFNMMQLAPDGKIYMNATNGVYKLHVIHNPDAKGQACNLEQHGLELPVSVGFTMPMYPHYRLTNWAGSPCDSLAGVAVQQPEKEAVVLSIAPNPAEAFIQVGINSDEGGMLRVVDVAGRLMFQSATEATAPFVRIDVQTWPAGVYYALWASENGRSGKGRFTVMR
jgi:hypothetical protein